MDIEGILHLLKAEPSLLPVAPDAASSADIERRRQDEAHSCLVCGERATTALLVEDPLRDWQGKRWLDLCYSDFARVRTLA
ncbi:hypothetical protein [Streptomyces sp. TRM75561]|uniref:hypothetical protein n=1 Tax=Streptomyces TaxID=1883 RepID=UPI0024488130|nr:hypothetical protein [Streptomyces sp. TRM75561]MDH3037948.1 hypothetical protein [Streptomyces sp. TRM75561]